MALSNKAMQTFSYMMLLSLAASTCGGLGILLYAQNTGQFSAPHPQRTPSTKLHAGLMAALASYAEPIQVGSVPYERKQGDKKYE